MTQTVSKQLLKEAKIFNFLHVLNFLLNESFRLTHCLKVSPSEIPSGNKTLDKMNLEKIKEWHYNNRISQKNKVLLRPTKTTGELKVKMRRIFSEPWCLN